MYDSYPYDYCCVEEVQKISKRLKLQLESDSSSSVSRPIVERPYMCYALDPLILPQKIYDKYFRFSTQDAVDLTNEDLFPNEDFGVALLIWIRRYYEHSDGGNNIMFLSSERSPLSKWNERLSHLRTLDLRQWFRGKLPSSWDEWVRTECWLLAQHNGAGRTSRSTVVNEHMLQLLEGDGVHFDWEAVASYLEKNGVSRDKYKHLSVIWKDSVRRELYRQSLEAIVAEPSPVESNSSWLDTIRGTYRDLNTNIQMKWILRITRYEKEVGLKFFNCDDAEEIMITNSCGDTRSFDDLYVQANGLGIPISHRDDYIFDSEKLKVCVGHKVVERSLPPLRKLMVFDARVGDWRERAQELAAFDGKLPRSKALWVLHPEKAEVMFEFDRQGIECQSRERLTCFVLSEGESFILEKFDVVGDALANQGARMEISCGSYGKLDYFLSYPVHMSFDDGVIEGFSMEGCPPSAVYVHHDRVGVEYGADAALVLPECVTEVDTVSSQDTHHSILCLKDAAFHYWNVLEIECVRESDMSRSRRSLIFLPSDFIENLVPHAQGGSRTRMEDLIPNFKSRSPRRLFSPKGQQGYVTYRIPYPVFYWRDKTDDNLCYMEVKTDMKELDGATLCVCAPHFVLSDKSLCITVDNLTKGSTRKIDYVALMDFALWGASYDDEIRIYYEGEEELSKQPLFSGSFVPESSYLSQSLDLYVPQGEEKELCIYDEQTLLKWIWTQEKSAMSRAVSFEDSGNISSLVEDVLRSSLSDSGYVMVTLDEDIVLSCWDGIRLVNGLPNSFVERAVRYDSRDLKLASAMALHCFKEVGGAKCLVTDLSHFSGEYLDFDSVRGMVSSMCQMTEEQNKLYDTFKKKGGVLKYDKKNKVLRLTLSLGTSDVDMGYIFSIELPPKAKKVSMPLKHTVCALYNGYLYDEKESRDSVKTSGGKDVQHVMSALKLYAPTITCSQRRRIETENALESLVNQLQKYVRLKEEEVSLTERGQLEEACQSLLLCLPHVGKLRDRNGVFYWNEETIYITGTGTLLYYLVTHLPVVHSKLLVAALFHYASLLPDELSRGMRSFTVSSMTITSILGDLGVYSEAFLQYRDFVEWVCDCYASLS